MSVQDLWIAHGVDHHLALHKVAADQALALGANDIEVVYPMVAPRFTPAIGDRCATRRELGIVDEPPLALVVAGSWGVGDVGRTVNDLAATGLVTPVVACGTNRRLLRELRGRSDVIALGWVDDMPRIMQACDIAIQNAGGFVDRRPTPHAPSDTQRHRITRARCPHLRRRARPRIDTGVHRRPR